MGEGTGLTSNQFQDKNVPLGGRKVEDISSSNEENPSHRAGQEIYLRGIILTSKVSDENGSFLRNGNDV